ncbi:hypothetical protein NE857_02270 [Nocardiopsis exhalans]|uniref:Uncharacterized protein n=1 Tax=Nocardiopsis exhalans TaxID=163604 RepID=A0ABY5D832_9ACTN|nr:hypothetical protein [Nocardiopsis exhalans]USY20506.1 hypothetical protein NE857_02270 [Nocardiopsis exhalans]
MSSEVVYDAALSQEVQATLFQVSSDVESLIAQRGVDVTAAMQNINAGEATDTYSEKELDWARAAEEVRGIIKSVEKTLVEYDSIANKTLADASDVVHNI